MRIVCLADIQNQCQKIKPSMIPDGEILVVAGDLTNYGELRDLSIFNEWIGKLPHKYKLVTLGNHEVNAKGLDCHNLFTNATLLHDELIEVEGFKIFGSPVNECGPYKDYWAYCEPSYIKRVCKQMPNCDVLITHGCPHGVLDYAPSNPHIGSKDILKAVRRIKPKIHIFGHAHSGYGTTEQWGTRFVNAALCNEYNDLIDYPSGKLLQKIQVVELA